ETDPAERMRLVREFVLTARPERAGDALTLLAPAVLAGLPGERFAPLLAPLAGGVDLRATTLRGVGHPVYQSGARVTAVYPFLPLAGAPIAATMVPHDGTCCVGVTVDPDAVTDVDGFASCLRDGFAEVLATADPPGGRSR
ncbi:MAG TPA: WS/DGAT domain-containing protein, partial [Pseudonocardiaceae bacterium]